MRKIEIFVYFFQFEKFLTGTDILSHLHTDCVFSHRQLLSGMGGIMRLTVACKSSNNVSCHLLSQYFHQNYKESYSQRNTLHRILNNVASYATTHYQPYKHFPQSDNLIIPSSVRSKRQCRVNNSPSN